MDQDMQEWHHQSALESPGTWLIEAIRLKDAAARLDPYSFPVRDDEGSVSLFPQYCMLLGMSLELLLKGLISFKRLDAGGQPSRPPTTHKLEVLAAQPECAFIEFTPDEVDSLRELTPFVVWGGRYPVPLYAKDVEVRAHGAKRQAAASDLWARLFVILRDSGWVMKGVPSSEGGVRLYTKPKVTP